MQANVLISTETLAEAVKETQDIFRQKVSFGNPTTDFANGVTDNIQGSWVEREVTALNTAIPFVHNLEAPVSVSGANNLPNVRALWWMTEHDGNSVAGGTATLSFNYDTRDQASITEDSFPLRFYAGGARVVDGDHPLRVTMFFISVES